MRYLFDGRIPIEWIFTAGNEETLAAYPGNLDDDLATVSGRLRSYADGRSNDAALAKTAQQLVEQSLRTFQMDWESLRKEFYDTRPDCTQYHPELTEIKALFEGEDTPANRILILVRIWKKIRELAAFKIAVPSDSTVYAGRV
ncbi:MAG: hypothetical protein WA628_25440 [Terriglobales bacterium]